MSDTDNLRLNCPECDAELVVDRLTGEILHHKKSSRVVAGGKTLESLMEDLEAGKSRAEDVFERQKSALADQDRLLEERFREAMHRAAESEDEDEPPLRPFDLD
jgi:hypothetical protein